MALFGLPVFEGVNMPRVMIVEDDLTILSNLAEILRLSGLDVVEAHDGQVAWNLLMDDLREKRAIPTMIVSDLMMPNMDGFELLSAVRADPELQRVTSVLLSARSDVSDMQQAFHLGANDYLVKPFDIDHLIGVIRYHLSEKKLVQKDYVSKQSSVLDSDFFLE